MYKGGNVIISSLVSLYFISGNTLSVILINIGMGLKNLNLNDYYLVYMHLQ